MPPGRRTATDFARLATEATHPRAARLDTLAPEAIAELMLSEEARAVKAAQARAPEIGRAAQLCAERLAAGGRLVYVGAGTSGRLGTLDAVECVPTFGVPPSRLVPIIAGGPAALTKSIEGAEDNVRDAEQRMRRVAVGPTDVVIGVAASGVTPFVRAALEYARFRRAATVFVTCAAPPVESTADVVDRAGYRARGDRRLDAPQGGDRHQDHAERHLDRRVRASGEDLRRDDGRRPADQRQAVGAGDPHRARAVRASTKPRPAA